MANLEEPDRGQWGLYMRWEADYGDGVVARGSRGEVERVARRIQRLGPSCGPNLTEPTLTWQTFDDDTEHMSTEAGELRLMQPTDFGDGVLLLARSDEDERGLHDLVAVQGVGPCAELREHAESHGGRGGRNLRLWIGDRPRHLRALGAEGIVGYLEHEGDLFLLGHLGGEEFGLVCQSGDVQRGLRKYTLEEVLRGDLGRVIERADQQPTSPARETSTGRGQRPGAKSRCTPDPGESRLHGLDLIGALKHLTPRRSWIGVASTVIPSILNGIRGLVQLNLDNETLWADGLLDLIALHTGRRIFCCRKILNAALRIIARRTRLLVRHGRRWLLRLGDLQVKGSRLLQWMKGRGPLDGGLTSHRRARHEQNDEPAQAPATGEAPATDKATPAATEPDVMPVAGSSPPATAATDPTATLSSAPADDRWWLASCESIQSAAGVASPAGRSPTSSESAPRASASGRPPTPPPVNTDPRLSSSPYDPGALPGQMSFEAFQVMLKDMLRLGRRPGVTSRGRPPWANDDDFDDFDPAGSGRGPGKRRHHPP